MRFDLYLMSRDHDRVNVHAWDPAGDVRDVAGELISAGIYRFPLEMSATDLRVISFKYWFSDEPQRWESDDYVRHPTVSAAGEVWTAEFSARCLYEDPRTAPPIAEHGVVKLGALTARKFSGGQIYAWDPGTGQARRYPETAREGGRGLSTFDLAVESWMRAGFHFKLVARDGTTFEPEWCNRFWRPVDGTEVYFKSGQIALHATCPALARAAITVTMPASSIRPALAVADELDDFETELEPDSTSAVDPEFVACRFELSLYP